MADLQQPDLSIREDSGLQPGVEAGTRVRARATRHALRPPGATVLTMMLVTGVDRPGVGQ